MCLRISKNFIKDPLPEETTPEPFIYEQDFVVYKTVKKEYVGEEILYWSPVQDTPIRFKDGMCEMSTDFFGIRWYPSFDDGSEYIFCINEGIHAHTNKLLNEHTEPPGLWRVFTSIHYAVIPAGTEFYWGDSSDIVAKRMIVFETEEDFEKYRETHNVAATTQAWTHSREEMKKLQK
mgnify:CR=1 FL=1